MLRYFILLTFIVSAYTTFAQNTLRIDSLLLDSKYNQAIESIDRELGKTTADDKKILLQNKKAEALIGLGRFEDADVILKDAQAKAGQNLFIQGITLTTFGSLYLNQGRNDLALTTLQQALNNFEQAGKSNTLEAAQALSTLGNLYRATGKFAQAEEQLTMALTIRQKLLKANHELIAASYNDLGLTYYLTDANKAESYYEKALAIYEKVHGNEHPKIAIANTNIGVVNIQLTNYGEAVNNFESALAIWEKIYPGAHPSKAFVLFNLGNTYAGIAKLKSSEKIDPTNDLNSAREFYGRSLAMYEQSYGKKHPEIARLLNVLGNMSASDGKWEEALTTYQRAMQANVSNFESTDQYQNPRLKNYYDGYSLLYSMLYKAEALESVYYGKTLKFKELELALHTLQTCDTLIDKLRQQISNESDKLLLGTIATEVYADGVRMATEANNVAWHKKGYAELAFYFAEKSKSAVLLEAISEAGAKSFAGIPADLLEQEKSLKSAIALCSQKLAQKPSEAEEKRLRETSFTLNRNYEAFIKNLEVKYPEYFNLKFNTTSPSTTQLQARLASNTALLSYFIDEKNNRLYIFQILKKKVSIIQRSVSKDVDRYITGMRNGLFFNDLKVYRTSASELSKLLLPQRLPSSIDELVILPTGRLSIIPFEALFTKKANETNTYQSLPYLLNRYAIRYEFSAGLILQKANTTVTPATSVFLCAPISFPEKDELNELPGTEAEVNEIASLFSKNNINTSLYTKKDADENRIKTSDLKKYSYLHFATHGVVDETNPELSRIFLQTNSANEDGNLFAGEIYNLELKANLVTLSACQTGLGKISKGEGVIGLSRAFVYAGAQHIIVSFWSVADESTSILMQDFYRQTLESKSANFSEPLRKAKINLIKNEKYAAPYYWAPFVLIGY